MTQKRIIILMAYIFTLMMSTTQVGADSGINCSDSRIQIGFFSDVHGQVPISDVSFSFSSNIPRSCVFTFSTEAATSTNSPQLMVLSYEETTRTPSVTYVNGIPQAVTEESISDLPIEGPIVSVVRDGFDQTHTFVNKAQIQVPFSSLPDIASSIVITPLLSSAFGRQYRIARHCLLVDCP
jgi:hypothetical protein